MSGTAPMSRSAPMCRVALLHGFTGAPAVFDELVAMLPPSWEAFRPALLGHHPRGSAAVIAQVSASAPGPAAARVAAPVPALAAAPALATAPEPFIQEVDRLAELISDWLAPSAHPAGLVGYSLGARLGLGLLDRHPRLFDRATLIGPHPGLVSGAARSERARADHVRASALERDGLVAFVDQWEREPLFATQHRLSSDVRARQRAIRLDHDAFSLASALRDLGLARMPNYRSVLTSPPVPLTLVVGEADEKFRALLEPYHAPARGAWVAVVPSLGHNVLLEAPRIVRDLAQGRAPSSIDGFEARP